QGLAAGELAATGAPTDHAATGRWLGGVMLGATAGTATGLVASKWIAPESIDYVTVAGASLAGQSLGRGVASLAFAEPGRLDPAFALAGGLAGLASGAAVAHTVQLRPLDLGAGAAGAAVGALAGTLAPTFAGRMWRWDGDDARAERGGAYVGLALGGAGAAAAAHAAELTSGEIALGTTGGLFGIAAGAGAGMLLSDDADVTLTRP